MKKLLLISMLLVLVPSLAWANQPVSGFCTAGAAKITTTGIISTTQALTIPTPQCTVTVYIHGSMPPAKATIYSDNNNTPLTNPFLANAAGAWTWYAAQGRYDTVLSGAGFPSPFTRSDDVTFDPSSPGAFINGLNGCLMADQYASVPAAVTAAGTTGCVIVPPGDTDTTGIINPNNIPILSFTQNQVGVWNVLGTVPNAADGSGNRVPGGADLVLQARGAADTQIKNVAMSLTSNTSVSPGVATLSMSGNPQNTFFLGACLLVDQFTDNFETVCGWSMTSTTITGTFAVAHTAPFTVQQMGASFFWGWLFRLHAPDFTNLEEWLFSKSTAGNWDSTHYWLNSQPLFEINQANNIPTYFGKAGTGLYIYGGDFITGHSGTIYFKNNRADAVTAATINTANGNITNTGTMTTTGNTASNNFTASGDTVFPVTAGKGVFAANATSGGYVSGSGLTDDFVIAGNAGSPALHVPHNTLNVDVPSGTLSTGVGFTANGTPGATATVVVKGSAGANCNLVFKYGLFVSTTCP